MIRLKLTITALITLIFISDDIQDILNKFETKQLNEKTVIETDFHIASVLHFIPVSKNRNIIIDGIQVILINENGNELSRIGRRGRGPGEFSLINDAFIDKDGILYVFDASQRRISTFKVENDNFVYQEDFLINSIRDRYRLRKFFPTTDGYYGVFKKLSDDDYVVVMFNDKFDIVSEKLNFSSEDFPEVVSYSYTEQITYTYHNSKFYYSDKYTLAVFECEIEESKCSKIFDGIGHRKVSDEIINYFEVELGQYPIDDMLNQLKNNGIIDWVHSMSAIDNYLVFPILTFSDIDPVVLKVDIGNGKVNAISMPLEIGKNLNLVHIGENSMVFNVNDGAYFDSLVKVRY